MLGHGICKYGLMGLLSTDVCLLVSLCVRFREIVVEQSACAFISNNTIEHKSTH